MPEVLRKTSEIVVLVLGKMQVEISLSCTHFDSLFLLCLEIFRKVFFFFVREIALSLTAQSIWKEI